MESHKIERYKEKALLQKSYTTCGRDVLWPALLLSSVKITGQNEKKWSVH